MSDWQIYLVVGVFSVVILVIAFDLIDMAVAALVGTSLLIGGMVVARILATTGLFDLVGDYYLRATGGSGKRFLLLLIVIVAPLCALLPNATTVTFLVGSSIGMSFGEYLRRASLGGVLAIAVVIPLLPVLMRGIWRTVAPLPPRVARAKL